MKATFGAKLSVVMKCVTRLLKTVGTLEETRQELLTALEDTTPSKRGRERQNSTAEKNGDPTPPKERAPKGEIQKKLLENLQSWIGAKELAEKVGIDPKRIYLELARLKDKIEKRGEKGSKEYRVSA